MATRKTHTSAEVKNRYNAKAYDRIALMVPKGTKAAWQAEAERLGLSLNAYIRLCVEVTQENCYFEL